jgi:glycosyltransferase involved in cell wall biosynthesis
MPPDRRVLVNVALVYLDALRSGGYPRDVRWLAGALAERCDNVWMIADEGNEIDGLGSARPIRPQDVRKIDAKIDVSHSFGIFLPRQLLLQRRLRSFVNVVSPLGQLMESHVSRRAWKKHPYLLAARPVLMSANLTIHVFSEAEKPGVRRHLPSVSSFAGSLGVYPMPPEAEIQPKDTPAYLLFFGRNDVHHKGIDVALEGYALAARRGLRLRLVISGNAQGNSDHIIRSLVKRLDLIESVDVLGRISEPRKWALLRGARALVFLSRWDGPPRPIREALAVGTPVIVSSGTNLSELVRHARAGRGVELDPYAVADAMISAQNEAEVTQWREGAAKLRNSLSWDRVADQYLRGYRHAVGTPGAQDPDRSTRTHD